MKRCPPGKVHHPKTNRCIKKKGGDESCPPGKVRNPKTNRCIKKKPDHKHKDTIPKEVRIQLDAILKYLREPKLKDAFQPFMKKSSQQQCLKHISTDRLKAQLDSRENANANVNLLIPRKKIKTTTKK